jgi:nitrate reductase (cytochrome)
MDRRGFLKASAMAAATAAAARIVAHADTKPPSLPQVTDGVTWDKAPCRFCGTGCHVQVGVKDRRVVAIAGDQKADVNKGLLCVKGYHVALALYGKDRLTRPLLRVDGKLVPITWERALDVIADRVLANPAGFAMYGSGQWTIPEGYAAQKLIKAGLANNQIDPNARLCMASAVTGYLSTYGVDEPAGCYEDLDRCDTLVIWGNNPAEMHPVLFSRVIDRRSRGEKVTIVDLTTRRTRTSAFTDRTILFAPQGDLAIANGIAHLLLERGTWDRAFVEKFCNFRKRTEPATLDGQPSTLDEYRRLLAEYTPARVSQLAGISVKELEYLADLFGDRTRRITSVWCMGPNQHTRGTAINALLHGIHLLSGHFGRPGDAPTSLTGQPSACGTVREVGTLGHGLPGGLVVTNAEHRAEAERYWNLPAGRINAKPGYHTVEMWRRFSTPKDAGGDIDTIWVQVTNPARSLPNINTLFEPSRKLPGKFLIVSDVYPTATAMAADLVLPSAMWVEKNGMFGNSERRTQQWFKMVPPPGEARDDCWQTIAVARRLHDRGYAGMKDKDGRFLFHVVDAKGNAVPVWDWRRYYDVNVDEHLFEEYRKFTRHKHKDLAPYREYVAARGLRWPVVKKADGSWQETKFRFAQSHDPYAKREIQFYHSVTKDDRALIWFHPWEAPPEVPDAAYPMWLCTGRVLEHWHTGTITMRIPQLHRAMPQAYCELHRDDARKLGIADGEVVIVESRRGSAELPVWIDGRGRPPPGTVFVPFFDESIAINRVTLEAHDPLSKQPDYKKCAVRIRKRARP